MSTNTKNLLFTLFFAATTYFIGSEMKKWMSSKEVVAFEFIKTEAAANSLLSSEEWQQVSPVGSKIDRLRENTKLDFLYIISYVFLFFFLARWLLGESNRQTKILGLMLLVAGLSDAAENTFLLQILNGSRGGYPAAMFFFASVKFGLLLVFVFLLAFLLLKQLISRAKKS